MAVVFGVPRSRFVVVGGGIAGVTCAEKVRAVGLLPAGRMRAPRRLAVRAFVAVSGERGFGSLFNIPGDYLPEIELYVVAMAPFHN